jgi:hypothetical protein
MLMRAGIRPERQPSRVAARRRPTAFGVAHGRPSEPAGAPLKRPNLYPKKLLYTLCELPHISKADLLLTWVCARLHTILAQASTLPHPCWLGRIPALGIRFHTHQFLWTGCGNFWLCFGGAFFFVGTSASLQSVTLRAHEGILGWAKRVRAFTPQAKAD